jgi:fatty-acyl-CoA synthase
VAILAGNCVEYLDLVFACAKLGAILQTLNWRLTARELAELITDAGPVALVYGPGLDETVTDLRRHASLPHWVALDSDSASAPAIPFAERETFGADQPPRPDVRWSDTWLICYTGGTTGLPKGALLTYRSVAANSVNTVVGWGLSSDDTAILNAPLFHTGGLNVFTVPLVHAGGTSVVCRGFDAGQVFDLLRDGGISLLFGVPTMFISLQQHPRWAEADFSRLKLVIAGGAPCPLPVQQAFWTRGVDFRIGYGLTEAGPNNFYMPAHHARLRPASVGRPLFHVDVKVVAIDDESRECGPGETGQLLIRGPHVCGGYWRRPQETAQMLAPGGWLRTGDLAQYDDEGYYVITGRSKDMFISGGENVYPAEVESVIAMHPAVAEVCVIGIPDATWGEAGRAIVVLRSGASLDKDELAAFCRERLAKFKVPRSVVLADLLPRTGAGKVDRRLLSEVHGGETAEQPGG